MVTNNEISNSKKRIKLIYVIIFVVFIFSLVGVTFSAWDWFSSDEQKTIVTFDIDCETNPELCEEYDYSCAADGGGNITTADVSLAPTTCMDTTYAIQREIKVMPTIDGDGIDINMDAWLKINEIGEGFTNSRNLRYALTTSSSSCTSGVVSSGNFYGKEVGDTVPLLNKGYSATASETYYLYIWLDVVETSPSTMRQPLNLSLGGQCGAVESSRGPVLDEGMIPVKLSSDGTVRTILENDFSWYNYENKQWANAVLVDDDSRGIYKDTTDVIVDQDDILAYYVWIPRYKYKIWNTGMGTAGSEQTIDVVFESASDEMSLGTQVGEYRTHPAFWWDDNNDGNVDAGETVAGIWVGKFETSTEKSSTCYTSVSSTNCNNENQSPRILPNVKALIYQNVKNQFITSQKFSASGNIYGLSNTTTNAHMMKNSEWGAVAYLAHSVYGINDEITINNNSSMITGCGATSSGASYAAACEIGYNSESTPQSTTGNITGVFDMVGGAWEYVMGYYSGANSSYGFGSTTEGDYSGFYTYSSTLESKYWNNYTTNNSLTACNGGICYGHALSETANWYNQRYVFLYENTPWLSRGDYYDGSSTAGLFYSYPTTGVDGNAHGFRSVLVMGNYDSEPPTCSLSVDGTTINANYSDNSGVMGYYGWDSSYTGDNSTSIIIDGVGTYTYYVMDSAGNTGSCSMTVTGTTHNSWPLYCTGNCSGLDQASCNSNGGCYWNGQGQYCTGTYEYQCNTYHEYVCGSGYTKINDSYCYILG